jgi:hypothetical protein
LINEQRPDDVGRYAGWGEGEDANTPPDAGERPGPAMMPFLRYRAGDRWWRLSLGFLWLPAIVIVITVGDWIHLSQSVIWISLGVLTVALVGFALLYYRPSS